MSSVQNIFDYTRSVTDCGWRSYTPEYALGNPYFSEKVTQVSKEYLAAVKSPSKPTDLEFAVFAIDLIQVVKKGYKFVPSAQVILAQAVNAVFVSMMSFVCAYENYQDIRRAQAIGDTQGENIAKASFTLNSIAFGTEASYFPMLALGASDAGKYFSLHPVATALFANCIAIATLPLYVFKTIWNIKDYEKASTFSTELHAILDEAESVTERLTGALEYLFEKLTLTDKDFEKACQKGVNNPVDQTDLSLFDLKDERRETIREFLRNNNICYQNPDRERILNGILEEVSKATKLKEKELKRLVGSDGLAMISYEKNQALFDNLHFLLGVGSVKAKVEPVVRGILNEILRENQIIKIKKAGYIAAGATGIVLTILSLFHFGSFPMAAVGMSLTLLALDMHSLYRSYATKDEDFLKSIAMFVATIFVLGVAASSLVLSPHIVGAIVCVAILISWTAARMRYQITAE